MVGPSTRECQEAAWSFIFQGPQLLLPGTLGSEAPPAQSLGSSLPPSFLSRSGGFPLLLADELNIEGQGIQKGVNHTALSYLLITDRKLATVNGESSGQQAIKVNITDTVSLLIDTEDTASL